MKNIIIAGHVKYWENDNGTKRRIISLMDHLRDSGFQLVTFLRGDIGDADRKILDQRRPGDTVICSQSNGAENIRLIRYSSGRKDLFLEAGIRDPLYAGIYETHARDEMDPSANAVEKMLSYFYSLHFEIAFKELCRNTKPDFVIVERIIYHYLVENIREYSEKTRSLVDTHDVLYRRCEAFHQRGQAHWLDISETEEKACLEKFDVIMAIQSLEADIFRSMVPSRKVICVGHAERLHAGATKASGNNAILFVASENLPGLQAIKMFANEVWPGIIHAFGAKVWLRVAGTVCSYSELSSLGPNIELLGLVPDLRELYESASIVINPTDFGGGLKIKNVEALCYGKPLLTTPTGAEGMESGSDSAFFVCKTPQEFGEKLTALIRNHEQQEFLSAKALEYAGSSFAPKAAYGELMEDLNQF